MQVINAEFEAKQQVIRAEASARCTLVSSDATARAKLLESDGSWCLQRTVVKYIMFCFQGRRRLPSRLRTPQPLWLRFEFLIALRSVHTNGRVFALVFIVWSPALIELLIWFSGPRHPSAALPGHSQYHRRSSVDHHSCAE
jgi:hypothetical protein